MVVVMCHRFWIVHVAVSSGEVECIEMKSICDHLVIVVNK